MTTRISKYSILLTCGDKELGIYAARLGRRTDSDNRLFQDRESRVSALVQRGYAYMVEEIAPFNDTTLRISGEYIPSEEGKRTLRCLMGFLRRHGLVDMRETTVLRSGNGLETLTDDKEHFE